MSVPMKTRKSLPASKMGMPAQDKYPMPDKPHAINAKARAKQMLDAGKLKWPQYQAIVRKANAVIGGK